MKNKVVTVSAKAWVAGYYLGVCEATVTLAVNAVPTVQLECAPSELESYKPLVPHVYAPTISDFSDLYRDLAQKAEGMSEECEIYIETNGDDHDVLHLKRWILAGVGLSSITAVSAPHLVIVAQHPICKLTKVGAICETTKSNQSILINAAARSGTDVIKIMQAVYTCARDVIEYLPSPSQYAKMFRQNLGVGDFDPGKYLEYSGSNGIFLSNAASGLKERIAQAIGRMVFPSTEGSTWDTLVRLCGMLMLNITQNQKNNYTGDKLVIEPMQPWKKYSITLDEDWSFSTDVPGMNPFKIIGVMSRKLGPQIVECSLGLRRDLNAQDKAKLANPVSEVLYVPKMSDVSLSDGRIMMTSAPAVLEQACRINAPKGKFSSGFIDALKTYADGFDTALTKYCQAVYECTACSMVQGSARMALGFRDFSGQLILPGNTCRFRTKDAKGKRKPLYYGYIRQVVHHLSAKGGCETIVAMSYMRPDEGLTIKGKVVIPAGSPNAAYE